MNAFSQIFEQCAPIVLSRLRTLTNDDDLARDILQDIFIGLFERAQKLPEDLSVLNYLIQAAKFRFYKKIRSDLVIKKYQDAMELLGENEAGAEPVSELRLNWLIKSIQELPDRCREAFIMYYFHGLSYKDISEKMKISVRTVEKHLAYGHKKILDTYKSERTS